MIDHRHKIIGLIYAVVCVTTQQVGVHGKKDDQQLFDWIDIQSKIIYRIHEDEQMWNDAIVWFNDKNVIFVALFDININNNNNNYNFFTYI